MTSTTVVSYCPKTPPCELRGRAFTPTVRVQQWSDIKEALGGVSEEVAEQVRKASGPARHRARVRAAHVAANEWVSHKGVEVGTAEFQAFKALTLWVEVLGDGGPGGLGKADPDGRADPASARFLPFSHLGKGRRQASDGPVWSEAIRQAAEETAGLVVSPEQGEVVALWDRTAPYEERGWFHLPPSEVVRFLGPDRGVTFLAAVLAGKVVRHSRGEGTLEEVALAALLLQQGEEEAREMVAEVEEMAAEVEEVEEVEVA